MTPNTTYTAPLVVLEAIDGTLVAHRPDVQRVELPAEVTDLASAAAWALAYGLGSARLHKFGEDSGPLLVLTESATVAFGLPVEIEDRKNLRLPADHPAAVALTEAGWSLSRAGLAPWSLLFKGREEVRIAVLPWDAFGDHMRWGGIADVASTPSALAYSLGLYAERVLSPTGSTAGCGLALMEAVRPPTRIVFEKGTGRMHREPIEGSLSVPVDPAPPEAIDEHPVAEGRTREEAESPAHVQFEEVLAWWREPTEEERRLPYVVGLDINTAFLAASNRLTVGLGAAEYTDGPAFDKKIPGTWLVDFSGVRLRTRDLATKQWKELPEHFPSPFTPTGAAPTGPAWYTTQTVAYAVELGVDVRPIAGWLRPQPFGYLNLWYERLQGAYMETLADLGITPDMPEEKFLDAMESLGSADPEALAVLSAIKQTAKGGLGKMRERPRGKRAGGRHAPWPALKRPTWRADIRAAVISAARVGGHRKMVKTWNANGLVPLAVLSDCVIYASAYPTVRAVVPRTPEGGPLSGGFRIGPNPGYCKQEGVRPLAWYVETIGKGLNPGRYIKAGRDAVAEGE
ncbi:transcriptional regulator [Kitasatospora sp. NPDC004723]|uniref:telomere-associated protein Tap n=1 Tax=Kitasatospora sp. NPDC004723 TaxID=3154288 RepID=UPI0033AFF51A